MVLPSKGWLNASRNQAWNCRPSARTASDKKGKPWRSVPVFFK
jgi:hypothetical protein